jgi:hypothetical protein
MNLFNDPFLQEFPRNKELLKLRDSTELAQNTTQHFDHDQLSMALNNKSESTVAPLDVDSRNKLTNLFNDLFLQDLFRSTQKTTHFSSET